MTDTFQVTCHRPDPMAHRRILGLGGPGGWYRDEDTLIAGITNGDYRLWTTTPKGESVWIMVERPQGKRPFLKTEPDGVEPNNLLALPCCP
jgi:hypothetical protein